MSDGIVSPSTGGCRPVFVVGTEPHASAVLYRLLCLHPEIAYLSRFEHRLGWLPIGLCGHIRLRRFATKLRWWFREPEVGALRAALMRQVEPAPHAALHRRLGFAPEAGSEHAPGTAPSPDRIVDRLRHGFARLQNATGCRVVVTHCSADAIGALSALLPQARYLHVYHDAADASPDGGEEAWIRRRLDAVPPERVRRVQYERLIREPMEVMRQVLGFLDLQRRLDYEWALKALDLSVPEKVPQRSDVASRGSPNGSPNGLPNGSPDGNAALRPRGYAS